MLELFRRMWMGWQAFARALIRNQNVVLMGIAYVVALGPVALVSRLVGRKFLDRAPADPRATTYWHPRRPSPMTMDEASRPF